MSTATTSPARLLDLAEDDPLETLSALVRWARLLARWRASTDPRERKLMIQRFDRRDASRCIVALLSAAPVAVQVETPGTSSVGLRLNAIMRMSADASKMTPEALVGAAIIRTAKAAFTPRG